MSTFFIKVTNIIERSKKKILRKCSDIIVDKKITALSEVLLITPASLLLIHIIKHKDFLFIQVNQ